MKRGRWGMMTRPAATAVAIAVSAAASRALAWAPMSYFGGYGTKAYPVVGLTWDVLITSIVVVVIISLLVLWAVLARRTGSAFGALGSAAIVHPPGGLKWITWGVGLSFIPLVITLVWTVAVLAQVNQPSGAEPFTIEVTGHQWWWEAKYLDTDPQRIFVTANEIHIPVGHPVRFTLKGGDVIHSFWVPALSGKMDTIPGQTNVTWLEADRPGRYRGQCTEYCGFQHAHMAVYVVADPPAAFRAWWDRQLKPAPAPAGGSDADKGAALFVTKCGACHAVAGTIAQGHVAPDLTHLMSRKTIAAGAAPNTPAGLSGWIANPQAVKPGTLMPTLYLSGPELTQVRAYLLTLQ